MAEDRECSSCTPEGEVDESHLCVVALSPEPSPSDYRAAMALAEQEAAARLEMPMLIAWYDRERDFESPQHSSECHLDSAVPGYVDYAHSHGATLKLDIESGRFVFYFLDAAL